MFFFGFVGLAICIIEIIAMWKVFEKAGRPGWESIIPFYSTYVLFKIGGKPGWWLLLILTGPFFLIWAIWGINMVSKSFGKDEGFTVGLLFLGFIFWPILGFGDAVYLGPYGNPTAFKAAQNPQLDLDQQPA